MKNWNKYEVKDSTRDYWTIFFRATNLDEAKANPSTRLGSEGYCDVDWFYCVLFGSTKKMSELSDKQVDKLVDARGIYRGVFEWEAHIDNLENPKALILYAPSPEQFLRHYVDRTISALTSACHGNVIENSVDEATESW